MGKRMKFVEISKTEHVECPLCNGVSELGEWDDNTFKMCINREQRRDFVSLAFRKSWEFSRDLHYNCPKCNRFSRSSSLRIVDTDDKKLMQLGGRPNYYLEE